MDLRDRVALVTGGAKRIGRAIALRLARAHCHVAIHFHTSAAEAEATAAECRAAGVRAETFGADLGDPSAAAELVARVLTRLGRLDVLVNNASVFEPMRLDDFNLADWERALRVNLTAAAVLVHAAREALRRARGRVVNLCDASTSHPWPDYLAYAVSKGGLVTLTQVLARAMAPEVNVVGVAPGVAAWPPHYDESLRARILARVPLGRAGTPEDIAAAVHFLVTEGDYITGLVLPVDGGRRIV